MLQLVSCNMNGQEELWLRVWALAMLVSLQVENMGSAIYTISLTYIIP